MSVQPQSSIDIDGALNYWLHTKGRIDELNEELSNLTREKTEAETQIRRYASETGLTKFGNDKLTVSVDPEALAAKYDPEKWTAIVRWAVESGNDHIIQRRLTDAKVIELVENGVALPEGLKLDPYVKLSLRRK